MELVLSELMLLLQLLLDQINSLRYQPAVDPAQWVDMAAFVPMRLMYLDRFIYVYKVDYLYQ